MDASVGMSHDGYSMEHPEGMSGMGGMSMSMAMTFSSFWETHVTVLWDWWAVSEPAGYSATCFIVAVSSVLYHALLRYKTKTYVEMTVKKDGIEVSPSLNAPLMGNSNYNSTVNGPSAMGSPTRMKRMKFALISALCYAVSLLLMLVAMTYNTGLFISLVTGYFIGVYVFGEGAPSIQSGGHCQ